MNYIYLFGIGLVVGTASLAISEQIDNKVGEVNTGKPIVTAYNWIAFLAPYLVLFFVGCFKCAVFWMLALALGRVAMLQLFPNFEPI